MSIILQASQIFSFLYIYLAYKDFYFIDIKTMKFNLIKLEKSHAEMNEILSKN